MAIAAKRPVTPAQRGMTSADMSAITAKKPVKSLLAAKTRKAGRNNSGRITVRHRGGGAKRHYRIVNFNLEPGTTAVIEAIEYDPNRSARIARIKDQQGGYHYVLAAAGMKVGQNIHSGADISLKTGNRLALKDIPLGTQIHNIELHAGRGGRMVRTAGAKAQLMAKEGQYAQIKLPSGEVRRLDINCAATIGAIGNDQHQNVKLGSAGRKRRKGIRPTVRGIVMNAADHPHGGGEGKGKGGNDPVSPWGQPTLGFKTRRRKQSDKLIVRSRHSGRRG